MTPVCGVGPQGVFPMNEMWVVSGSPGPETKVAWQ